MIAKPYEKKTSGSEPRQGAGAEAERGSCSALQRRRTGAEDRCG